MEVSEEWAGHSDSTAGPVWENVVMPMHYKQHVEGKVKCNSLRDLIILVKCWELKASSGLIFVMSSSFAVVLWEMVTGERPYNGLSFFVVAYGVGHGTLTLPIPDSCPELLSKLMKGEL